MPDQQNLVVTPERMQAVAPRRRHRVVLITEIISPYRIPVFNALAEIEDIELHVIFLAETDPTQRQWLVYKSEIRFSYEVLPSWRRRFGRYHVLLNRKLRPALRRAKPDVIVCGGYNYLAAWECLWWARRRGVPFMVWVESTAHDQRNYRALIEFLKNKFMSSCDAFIVGGKSSGEYVSGFGARQELIFTAPDAVDIRLFAEQASLARRDAEVQRQKMRLAPRFFLFVGRLVPEKGVFDLLQAYGDLSAELRKEFSLIYVGEGPARVELERRAAAVAPGSIQFAGFAQRDELASYYGLAEVLVFPTHTDPWGLVVNEAMACSSPVICSQAAGCAADLIEDGWNGRIVPARDSAALASAMQQLARDGNLRRQMGERSWQRIQMYSPEACAAGIAEAARSRGGRGDD
jgi:glycosyltransferase involved in cell wall biosynthesis